MTLQTKLYELLFIIVPMFIIFILFFASEWRRKRNLAKKLVDLPLKKK